MKHTASILGALLSLGMGLALPAHAHSTGDQPVGMESMGLCASFGLTAAQGSSSTLTRQTWGGQTLEVGFRVTPPELGTTLQVYGGWGRMPGKRHIENRAENSLWGANTYDLDFWRLGLDLRFRPFGDLPVALITGPSFHNWKIHRVGGGADVPQAGDGKAVKMGWRLGLDVDIAQGWSVGLLFTQSEWRSEQKDVNTWPGYIDQDKTPSYIPGLNPSRPAYFSLVGTYRF